MITFLEWLVESRSPSIDPGVVQGYENAFKQALQQVIQRTQNLSLRAELEKMLDCPIRDSRGRCRSFTDYIVSALLRNGIHYRYDIEACLSYIFQKMMMDKSETGQPRVTVFGGFEERPGYVDGNPLQVQFMKYLQFAVNNIRKGKIPRLSSTEPRPQGTVCYRCGIVVSKISYTNQIPVPNPFTTVGFTAHSHGQGQVTCISLALVFLF